MKLMNFCKLLFAVLLFLFATFEMFFRNSFTTFLFAEEQDKKRYFTCWLCDSKLKWKFDICDSWLVTFLVREPCQRAPCTTVHNCMTTQHHALSGIMKTVNINSFPETEVNNDIQQNFQTSFCKMPTNFWYHVKVNCQRGHTVIFKEL